MTLLQQTLGTPQQRPSIEQAYEQSEHTFDIHTIPRRSTISIKIMYNKEVRQP